MTRGDHSRRPRCRPRDAPHRSCRAETRRRGTRWSCQRASFAGQVPVDPPHASLHRRAQVRVRSIVRRTSGARLEARASCTSGTASRPVTTVRRARPRRWPAARDSLQRGSHRRRPGAAQAPDAESEQPDVPADKPPDRRQQWRRAASGVPEQHDAPARCRDLKIEVEVDCARWVEHGVDALRSNSRTAAGPAPVVTTWFHQPERQRHSYSHHRPRRFAVRRRRQRLPGPPQIRHLRRPNA